MERSRHGEGRDYTSQPLSPGGKVEQHLTTEPPMLEASAADVADGEALDTPTIPGYLTLELDVSDIQVFTSEADTASTQPYRELYRRQDSAISSLDALEFFEPGESTTPGYLTLEIDCNASGDDALWRSSENAESDEPRGQT